MQGLNKKVRKLLELQVRIQRGDRGSGPPWKSRYMGVYME